MGADNTFGETNFKPEKKTKGDKLFDEYMKRVKEQLCCNTTEEYAKNNITYDYTNEQVEKHIAYFKECIKDNLSPYKALLFFDFYLIPIPIDEQIDKQMADIYVSYLTDK